MKKKIVIAIVLLLAMVCGAGFNYYIKKEVNKEGLNVYAVNCMVDNQEIIMTYMSDSSQPYEFEKTLCDSLRNIHIHKEMVQNGH